MSADNFPTHLTCPYCPAQSLPKDVVIKATTIEEYASLVRSMELRTYVCPQKHVFFAVEEGEERRWR